MRVGDPGIDKRMCRNAVDGRRQDDVGSHVALKVRVHHEKINVAVEGRVGDRLDLLDVCVVGIPDEYSGEIPLAYVVPQPTAVDLKDVGAVERLKGS